MATMASRPLLLAGSAALAVAGVGYYLSTRGSSSRTTTTSDALVVTDLDDDVDDKDDMITAQEVTQIFDRLFREMQAIFAQLMQQVQAIQMSGQNIPEPQLRAMLQGEMQRALAAKQAALLEEFDMDYECLEQATWEFLEDYPEQEQPAVHAAVNRFQKFWEAVSGQAHAGWRRNQSQAGGGSGSAVDQPPTETLEPERLIAVAGVYFDSLTAEMKTLVSEYKADGKNLKDPTVQTQLNLDFSERAQAAGERALQEEGGITMRQFEESIKAHASNRTVTQQLQLMQMKQQQELMSIGSS